MDQAWTTIYCPRWADDDALSDSRLLSVAVPTMKGATSTAEGDGDGQGAAHEED